MLIDSLYQYNIITNKGKTNPNCYRLIKKHPHLFEQILQITSFCSNDAKWTERLWCITNNFLSIPLCISCNKPVRFGFKQYNEFCSQKCARTSKTRTNRIKQTWLKNHGIEHPMRSKEIKEKHKQTMLENQGVENPMHSKEIKEKHKQTMLRRHGVEHAMQLKEIKEKVKQTNIKRYGTEYASQSKEIKEKVKQTWLKKYGVEHPNQKHMIKILPLLEDYDWINEEYITKRKTISKISHELGVDGTTIGNYLRFHNIHIKHIFGYMAFLWLESIMKEQNIFIQHKFNIGEYKILDVGFYVDGYCRETNTIYEFHGDYWHGNPEIYESDYIIHTGITAGKLYQKTIERENKIRELGYNLVTMWEHDFHISYSN
ncbi:MAG: DUF7487 domain-containing protein [Nitrosopumilaceae archaeon]